MATRGRVTKKDVEELAKALRDGRGPCAGDSFPTMEPWDSPSLYEWVREDFRTMARWLLTTYDLVPKERK